MMYRERVTYYESIEEEHKKSLEQQVDVILKMEEERLILLKEHKEGQEQLKSASQRRDELLEQNETLKAQLTVFETELLTLKEEVVAAQKLQKEN